MSPENSDPEGTVSRTGLLSLFSECGGCLKSGLTKIWRGLKIVYEKVNLFRFNTDFNLFHDHEDGSRAWDRLVSWKSCCSFILLVIFYWLASYTIYSDFEKLGTTKS